MFKNQSKELEMHLIYAGYHYFFNEDRLRLKSFFLERMKKCNIKSVMLTHVYMRRDKIITKERMEHYCNGTLLEHY